MVVTGLDAVNGRCLGLACRADKQTGAAAADARAENIPLHLKDFRAEGALWGRHPAAGALRLHPAGISSISGADPPTSARGASSAFPPGKHRPPPRGFPPHVPHSPPPARGFPPQTGPPRTGFLFADTATARERPEADLAVMVRLPGWDCRCPPSAAGSPDGPACRRVRNRVGDRLNSQGCRSASVESRQFRRSAASNRAAAVDPRAGRHKPPLAGIVAGPGSPRIAALNPQGSRAIR